VLFKYFSLALPAGPYSFRIFLSGQSSRHYRATAAKGSHPKSVAAVDRSLSVSCSQTTTYARIIVIVLDDDDNPPTFL
jgi:hypothetical protein